MYIDHILCSNTYNTWAMQVQIVTEITYKISTFLSQNQNIM